MDEAVPCLLEHAVTGLIRHDEVISRCTELPSFPRVVRLALIVLDTPEADFKLLSFHVVRDPAISTRVLSFANDVVGRTQTRRVIRDIESALTVIGLERLREIVMTTSLEQFLQSFVPAAEAPHHWAHALTVGICCRELARYTCHASAMDAALVAGLLHDVGRLWFHRFRADEFHAIRQEVAEEGTYICTSERERFGVDHGVVGAWLTAHWGLPENIVDAVLCHHECESSVRDPLALLIHVAEGLAHGIQHPAYADSRHAALSAAVCAKLGLDRPEYRNQLFGRIETRCREAMAEFGREAGRRD